MNFGPKLGPIEIASRTQRGPHSMTTLRTSHVAPWLASTGRAAARLAQRVLDAAFDGERDRLSRWLGHAWAGALYLAGVAGWSYFLNGGQIQLNVHDWLEASKRYAFLRDALVSGQLPLHMLGTSGLRGVTDRYLSVADTLISPQVVLLRYLDIGTFALFHILLLYSLGFVGMLILRRRYALSPVAFTAMFLLFTFNGHISDHIGVGHVHWAAYFLIPFFALLIFDVLERKVGWRWILLMSLLLFAIFLQGAFHLFVLCLAFMGVLALSRRDLLLPLSGGIAFSILLSMFRILPPALDASKFDTEFLSGFTSVGEMLTALVNLKIPGIDEMRLGWLNPLGYWELDHFLGVLGLAFVFWLGVVPWFRPEAGLRRYQVLWIPIALLSVHSIGQVYRWIHILHVPFLSSQRVSSRLLFLPLAMLIFLAAIHLQERLKKQRWGNGVKVLTLALVGLGAQDLGQHLRAWRVENIARVFGADPLDLSLYTVANHTDPPYIAALAVGLGVTLLTLLFLVFMAWNETKKTPGSP